MKNIIFVGFCLLSFIGVSDVLCWQVNESTLVDGNPIQQFLVPYPSTEDSWPAARVKLVSSDGTSSTILNIYFDDGTQEDGSWGVEPWETGSGRWETGIVQSSSGYNTIGTIQGALQGDMLSYPPEVMEALFIMELGYNKWSDDAGDYVWQTIAQSAPELYETLRSQYMYEQFDISPPTQNVWTPNFYTTPEPSTSILCLLGASLLALRRKKFNSY